MMAALAGVVHDRQGAAGAEHDHREDNQQGGLHGDLANAGPPVVQMNPTWGTILPYRPSLLCRLRASPMRYLILPSASGSSAMLAAMRRASGGRTNACPPMLKDRLELRTECGIAVLLSKTAHGCNRNSHGPLVHLRNDVSPRCPGVRRQLDAVIRVMQHHAELFSEGPFFEGLDLARRGRRKRRRRASNVKPAVAYLRLSPGCPPAAHTLRATDGTWIVMCS